MRIAIIGAGRVGRPLGMVLKAKGHGVVFGVRDAKGSFEIEEKTVGGAIAGSDVVIFTTPWTVAEALVCEHAPGLADKIVIDATNPLNPNETRLALGFDSSGVELLQSHARQAVFFKALNVASMGAVSSPLYPQGAAAGFVAGPNGPKKDTVLALVAEIGFEPVDVGDLRAARLLEPLAMLRLRLEESMGPGHDCAFLLGCRDTKQARSAHDGTAPDTASSANGAAGSDSEPKVSRVQLQ